VQSSFGVRIPDGVRAQPEWLPSNVSVVVLSAGVDLKLWRNWTIWVQVTSLQEAQDAVAAGAHGLIAKGSESGGRVGSEAAFILLQTLVAAELDRPIWVQGGVGIHTAAACIAGGATGVVLDSQLSLLAEASTSADIQKAIRAMDGSETAIHHNHQVYTRPDLPDAEQMSESEFMARLGATGLTDSVIPVGQDGALAKGIGERFRSVSGLISGLHSSIIDHISNAQEADVLGSGSPLARAHNTHYPVLQGPMTRVSDQSAFASAVADSGGLPFLALALMRGEQVRALVTETKEKLADRAWGVGILGFVPPSLRDEQLAVLSDIRPPFAIIAGGRPAQARELEANGTATYLHVPSPGLLDMFLQEGARRFVFEGRECGGHVGPRSSFVLWDLQIERLLAFGALEEMSIVFAGGIHDAQSAAMIAAMAAPLAAGGAKVGVLMGTAYLFTKEAVKTGAILQGYQDAVLHAQDTVLLETAPGHATRCLATEYVDQFTEERKRLREDGLSPQDTWAALEQLNVGRLRIAAKGLRRGQRQGEKQKLVKVSEKAQRQDGMFMVGQVATLRDSITTIKALHENVSTGSGQWLADMSVKPQPAPVVSESNSNDVAIIGMACVFPQASDKDVFWSNILTGQNAITEVPKERWDPDIYFDADSMNGEKTPSKWGGFLSPVPFDPLTYGIPPKSLESIEPIQLLSLQVAHDALIDAGYEERAFDRSRTSVIFGAEAGTELAGAYGFRAVYPQLVGELSPSLSERLPTLTEDSFPGVLANVIAGRIANRLDLGGVNFTVDAACASSLAAMDMALKELQTGTSDMVLCGGADLHNSINDYLLFSSVHALSKSGQCRSFDHQADGITLGEGVAVMVLKRLVDAERDGDRIYATVKGLGGSSDGRSMGLTAPRSDGQVRALERAYDASGISPNQVGLMEAHGTGTVVGDKTELETMERVMQEAGADSNTCALGSVKTNIGHTKCAAGMAGLIKSALSLYHGVLPATLNIESPNPAYKAEQSPFSLTNYSRPWLTSDRYAGVSSFGFGGTNFHVVLGAHGFGKTDSPTAWPAELFLFRGETSDDALETIQQLDRHVESNPTDRLMDLAYTVQQQNGDAPVQIAVVAQNQNELRELLKLAQEEQSVPNRVFFQSDVQGQLAMLFPGQGSQKPGMMAQLMVTFPQLRHYLRLGEQWADTLYPATAYNADEKKRQRTAITDTRVAQPTLGMVDLATASLLEGFGVQPDMLAGHSYGELVALCAAGAFHEQDLMPLSAQRGEVILEAAGDDPGTMAAVSANADVVTEALKTMSDVVIANINAPGQTVISGPIRAVEQAIEQLRAADVSARTIPVACAFHSPVVADASSALREILDDLDVQPLNLPVWSNTTAQPHSHSPQSVRDLLSRHVAETVRFEEQILNMYAAGARIFVEAGPGQVLCGLVKRILGDKPHTVIPCSPDSTGQVADFLGVLGALATHGISIGIDRFWNMRGAQNVSLVGKEAFSPTTWLVNGQTAWPATTTPPAPMQPVGHPTSAMMPPAEQPSERSTVVLEYLKNMRSMVADQRDVMLGYLGASPVVRPNTAPTVAVAASPAPVVEAELVAAPAVLEESLEEILVSIVSERTGYPAQMLDLDLDLEATLSIDSIKRIEILGALGETLGMSRTDDNNAMESLVEELAAVKTLRGILDWLEAQEMSDLDTGSSEESPTSDAPPAQLKTSEETANRQSIGRYVFEVSEAPPLAFNGLTVEGRSFAITPDDLGVAEPLRELLIQHGATVDLVSVDLCEWPYDGVIHLATLTPEDNTEQLWPVLESVRSALMNGTFWILGVTGLGGAFGRRENGTIPPAGSGLGGMLKSVAAEWADARVRAVDLNPTEDTKRLAQHIFDELLANDGLNEVGYCDQQRRVLHAVPATHNANEETDALGLGPDSVVLVTGGARGITSHTVIALAKRAQCHFELVGRTPLTPLPNDPELQTATDRLALRKLLIRRATEPDVVAIEKECGQILAQRAIRATMDTIKAVGGQATYHAVDVRDSDAFGAVVDSIYERHERVDGVIHGAGIIEDKLLQHKTSESFSRVYETKVNGAHTLMNRLRDDVGFVAFFSSVSGAFGNRGQTDYAAANDALDKLALSLNESLPGRLFSINWGPWGGDGMISAELETEYNRRGIDLIDLNEGVAAFLDELSYGAPDDAQVILMSADLHRMTGLDG